MTRALCASRPAEWWDTGDGGNRLALLLCGVCPVRERCAAENRRPVGVLIAGVAYSDAGTGLPVCHCGYPQTAYRGGPVWCCPRCGTNTSVLPGLPRRLYWRAKYRQAKGVAA